MGILSTIAIASISIYKFKKKQKINSEFLDPSLTKFIKKLPEAIVEKIDLIKNQFDIKDIQFEEALTTSMKDLRKMEFLFAFKKVGLKNAPPTPSSINFSNIAPEKSKDLSKLFALRYDADLSFRTYIPNKPEDFIHSLEEFSKKSKVKFESTQKQSFLHISNMDKFLDDLSKNDNLLTKFNKIVEENPKNSLTYLFDTQKGLSNNIKLKFERSLDSEKMTRVLETFKNKNRLNTHARGKELEQHLSNYLGKNPFGFFNILSNEKSVVIVDKCDNQTLSKIILKITEKTDGQIQTVDFGSKPLSEIITKLSNSLKDFDNTFKMTGKKTFLQIQNSEEALKFVDKNSPEYSKFADFLSRCEESQSIILVSNEPKFVSSLPLKKGCVEFECLNNAQLTEDASNLLKKTISKMQENDFSNINEKEFIEKFITPLCKEQMGLDDSRAVPNGILLYGSVDKANITTEAIKKSLNIYYEKIKFDGTDAEKLFEELLQQTKKASTNFEKNKKRTIIEIENLDEILTNQNEDNIRLIGRFKKIIEHISKNHHATILTKTQKSLDDFEPASIGGQRFELQYKL